MIRSRVFVFLAIALFLAGCLCAETAAAPVVNADEKKKTAQGKVKALNDLTKKVLGTAERKSKEAETVKTTAEEQKNKAMREESDAKTAAAAIREKKRKTEAEAVAQKAKSELEKCLPLYQTAKEKAEQASIYLNPLVMRAKELVQSAQINVLPAFAGKSDNYAQAIAKAATVTSDTQTLSGEINALQFLSEAESALLNLQAGARKVQVSKYQAESLLIVSNIEAKMSEAKSDIQRITENKEATNTIVQDMNTKLKTAPDTLKGFLNSLCTNAGGFLRTATNKVTEANTYNEGVQGRKTQLDKDLETLMARTDGQVNAGKDATTVKWHANYINGEIEKIKQALGAAVNAFSNAKNQQQQMLREMSQNNRESGSELKEKQKDSVPTEEVTNPIRNTEDKKTVITSTAGPTVIKADEPETTDTEKPIFGKSEDAMEKTSDQPIDANLDSTEQNKSAQLTHNEKQNPKDDNSELLNKDMLRKITKNMTNNSLIGGEVPTWSAANDSAVTVFIPLLVIVVMSAVLH